MSKSKLRKEYEARLGVVVGTFRLYDAKCNEIYSETSSAWWTKREYDVNGNEIYYEDFTGYWRKSEYARGVEIYYENSNGVLSDKRPCINKVFIDEQTGKKFKMTEIK